MQLYIFLEDVTQQVGGWNNCQEQLISKEQHSKQDIQDSASFERDRLLLYLLTAFCFYEVHVKVRGGERENNYAHRKQNSIQSVHMRRCTYTCIFCIQFNIADWWNIEQEF